MAIKVKAIERNVSFEKNTEKWAYVLQPDLYSRLTQTKVIQEAALRSGISKGAINAAWEAIGEVIKAWATEGHSVAVPGLGTMRFGIRATSVADVNKVGSDLITTRRVIFTPSTEIKDELKRTSINITCYDRNGEIVKRVNSADGGDIEDPDNPDTPGGGQPQEFTVSVVSSDANWGTVTGGGTFAQGTSITVSASPKAGYAFDRWNDGDTNQTRSIVVDSDRTLTAIFVSLGGGGL